MKREDLLKCREYWISKIQIDLFNLIESYRAKKGINKTELAAELGVTKSYITQVLNGDFDHKVSKLVDLALAFGKVPNIEFIALDEYIDKIDSDDARTITLSVVSNEATEVYDYYRSNELEANSQYKYTG